MLRCTGSGAYAGGLPLRVAIRPVLLHSAGEVVDTNASPMAAGVGLRAGTLRSLMSDLDAVFVMSRPYK